MRGAFVEIIRVALYRDLATRLKPEPESTALRAAKVCSPNENCRSNRRRSGSRRAPRVPLDADPADQFPWLFLIVFLNDVQFLDAVED